MQVRALYLMEEEWRRRRGRRRASPFAAGAREELGARAGVGACAGAEELVGEQPREWSESESESWSERWRWRGNGRRSESEEESVIEKRNESEVFFFFADEPRDPRLELRPRGIPLPPRNPKLPPQQQQPSRSQPRPRPRPPSSRSSRAPALLLESISKRDAAPSSTPRAAGITGCALRKAPETSPHTYS